MRHLKSLVLMLKDQLGVVGVGAEIGVWRGTTSVGLLTYFPKLILHAVDSWSDDHVATMKRRDRLDMEGARLAFQQAVEFAGPRCHIHWMTSEQASRVVPGGLDFVFIDACHLYEAVCQDISLWQPKIREGGVICGHDYDGRGDHFRWHPFGVKMAVDEWAQRTGKTVQVARGHIWWARV